MKKRTEKECGVLCLVTLLVLLIGLSTGCKVARKVSPFPRKAKTPRQEQIEREKSIDKLRKEIGKEMIKTEETILEERSKGKNTQAAEQKLHDAKKLYRKISNLKITLRTIDDEGNLRSEEELARETESLKNKFLLVRETLKGIRQLAKNSPPFASADSKKTSKKRPARHMDERDWVVERLGEPDQKETIENGGLSKYIHIFDPTPMLLRSRCWDSFNRTIKIVAPEVELWRYFREPEGTLEIVFMQDFIGKDYFINNEILRRDIRDRELAALCNRFLGLSGKFVVVSVNRGHMTGYNFLSQLFSGTGRFSGQFGLEAREKIARVTAPLPKLAIRSAIKDIKIVSIRETYQKLFNDFNHLIFSYTGELAAHLNQFSREIELSSKGKKASLSTSDIIKLRKNYRKAIASKEVKRQFQACYKIFNHFMHIGTKGVSKEDVQTVANAFTNKKHGKFLQMGEQRRDEFLQIVSQLQSEGRVLQKHIDNIEKRLAKMKIPGQERGFMFKQDEDLTIWLLLQGIETRRNDLKSVGKYVIEEPNLTINMKTYYYADKQSEPILDENKTFYRTQYDVSLQQNKVRLLGIALMPINTKIPGEWELIITITDNYRNKITRLTTRLHAY